ncbi:MAG: GNAT family N-acetyltransferase [Anaerolineae bacterium]|nr:GNAT family N-acetyltransferase [Anaerolineae bacterium]
MLADRLIPGAYRNHIANVQVDPAQVDDIIHWGGDELTRRGRRPSFQLSLQDGPSDLGERLLAHGFTHQGDEGWMVYTGVGALPPPNPAVEVETFGPGDEEAIQVYIDCYNISFGADPADWSAFGVSFRRALVAAPAVHYTGRVEGRIAGVMSLFYQDGLGCIYNVGTFPEFRGQRVAGTLLLRLLSDADALGCRVIYLQTLYQGRARPMYERLGFKTIFVRARYERLGG